MKRNLVILCTILLLVSCSTLADRYNLASATPSPTILDVKTPTVTVIPPTEYVVTTVLEKRSCASVSCANVGYFQEGDVLVVDSWLSDPALPECQLWAHVANETFWVCANYIKEKGLETYLKNSFEGAFETRTLLQGMYKLDTANPISGTESLRMTTDPEVAPYYFYYWQDGLPVLTGVVRLEVVAALYSNIRSFGIGWRIVKDNQLAIMFVRINYANNRIELVQNTSPHIWQTVADVPVDLRQNNPLVPFRFSVDINVDTLTYVQVRIHNYLNRTLPNEYVYDLNIANIPTPYEYPDGMSVKINPQGTAGVAATAWLDDVTIYTK